MKKSIFNETWDSWWFKTHPKSFGRFLKDGKIKERDLKFLEGSSSAGFAFSFYFIIFAVCFMNLIVGIPMGEAVNNPYSNEYVDPFKMKIAFAIGLVGSIYYGYEYFQHKKFLKEIEKVVKLTFF